MFYSPPGCPLAERTEAAPCCCVSYVTADSSEPVSTAVVANTDCPVWDHQHECRLSFSTELNIKDEVFNKYLVHVLALHLQASKGAAG